MLQRKQLLQAGQQIGLSVLAFLAVPCVQAQTLEEAVRVAATHDAQYLAQKGSIESRRLQARQAATAYWPYASASYTQKDTSSAAQGRTTTSLVVTQPLLSYDRYLTLQQSDSLVVQADTEERQAAETLVLRVFAAMAQIVGNREAMRAGVQQISGLGEQVKRARRMKELGQGTITEISDFEVKLAIAEANQLRRKGELQAAERSFERLTGLKPVAENIDLDIMAVEMDAVGKVQLLNQARERSSAVALARNQLDQAQLASRRKTAQYVPQVVAQAYQHRYSDAASVSVSGIAVSVSIPISGSSYYDHRRSAADIVRAEENLRHVESSTIADVSTLVDAVTIQGEEVVARERAVDAARLAVDANTKSYMGGIKSNIDILSSYQNLIDAETALTNAKIRRMEMILQLDMKSGEGRYVSWLKD